MEHGLDDSDSDSDSDSGTAGDTATALMTVRHRASSLPARRSNWNGTTRYEVVRQLGRGGMGTVYEARDREMQRSVAVKTLLRTDPGSVLRFKQEFRTLADLQHRNLVQLYEFVATETGDVFFSMELVHGANFLRYVRGQDEAPNYDRLRHALRELVEGVSALHAAGKLHRDIKPSNVLVTPQGRAVILDFGVAAELSALARGSGEAEFAGTVPFMAPEQARMEEPHPASDWYSVGVVLYAAMTGALPFAGSPKQIIEQKNNVEPVPPSERTEGVPPDLDALCMSLLQRDAELRPSGSEICGCLGASPDQMPAQVDGGRSLVGRQAHVRMLHDAVEETSGGGQLAVFVTGLSGMGKSALLRQFLDEQTLQHDAVVLRGRAYERESVPFKAVDAIIDALSTHLRRAARDDSPIALPEDMDLAVKVFPVLGRVPGITGVPRQPLIEPTRIRRRAFAALRELFAAAVPRGLLILYVDDAQWGDADSAALLLELLRPPIAFRLLLIASYPRARRAAVTSCRSCVLACRRGWSCAISRSAHSRSTTPNGWPWSCSAPDEAHAQPRKLWRASPGAARS